MSRNARLISVRVKANVSGQLWQGGRGETELAETLSATEWGGSQHRMLHVFAKVAENRDFQPDTVRLESVAFCFEYRRGRHASRTTLWASEPLLEKVNREKGTL